MRNLLARVALWFCRRAGVNLVEQARLWHSPDAVERGKRWEQFYREDGGIADMIVSVRKGYFEASAALGISETDRIYEYALADRIAREIDRQVQGIIISGQIEADNAAKRARASIGSIRR